MYNLRTPEPWITPKWINEFPKCIVPEINGREYFEKSREREIEKEEEHLNILRSEELELGDDVIENEVNDILESRHN